MKRKTLFVCVLILFFYICLQCIPYGKEKGMSIFYREDKIKVIAHGGAKLLYPENTIYAFEQVMQYPIDGLEVDLRLSKDEKLVTIHNESIDAYTKYSGNVIDYTYDELKTMNFGAKFHDVNNQTPFSENLDLEIKEKLIPMEVSDLLKEYTDVFLILEVKDTGENGKRAMEILHEKIVESSRKDVLVCSFDAPTLQYFMNINKKEISCVMDKISSAQFILANTIGYGLFLDFEQEGMMLPREINSISLNSAYLIWKIHKNNKFVYYWTINEVEDMKQLIEDGADGIISDRVDLLSEILEQ